MDTLAPDGRICGWRILADQYQLFLACGKDTPNTMKDRDMTFTSAARFLILDPEGLANGFFNRVLERC